MALVLLICDAWHSDKTGPMVRLLATIERTIVTVKEIKDDVELWAELSARRACLARNEIDDRITTHENRIMVCAEYLSIEMTLRQHTSSQELAQSLRERAATDVQWSAAMRRLMGASSLSVFSPTGEDPTQVMLGGSSGARDSENRTAPRETSGPILVLREQHTPESVEEESKKWMKFVSVVPGQHGRFKINENFAPIHGGFSDVWQCEAKFSDGGIMTVAVKKFRAVRVARDADAEAITLKLLKRLSKELDIWMALQHPNITPILGFVLGADLCILSPWYANGNVAAFIEKNPRVNREQLMLDVARGLAYLHRRTRPIIHGDLKPDNILINEAGKAVIIDFGLSSIIEDDPTLAMSLTSASLQDAGNARWMAPELLMEENCTRSISTDVYSFGCLALYIYTGEIPFLGIPTFRIVQSLIRGQKPVENRDDYNGLTGAKHDWVYALLTNCWDVERASRPGMADVVKRVKSRGTISSSLDGTNK
ncbi:hypothetical protein FRB90_006382 [Tulasnella sp. 427]|nr:hypothetical protein FRB90_006382 [Tulasnella sp. 427]